MSIKEWATLDQTKLPNLKTFIVDCITDRVHDLDDERAAVLILRDFTRCIVRAEVSPNECYETLDDVMTYLSKSVTQLDKLRTLINQIKGQAKDFPSVSAPVQ